MSSVPTGRVSREEYLDADLAFEKKLELVNGVIVAMAGASPRHNAVVTNVAVFLSPRLRDRCVTFAADQRVRIDETGAYVYPDVAVGCGELRFTDERPRSLLNPVLIVEVISKSKVSHDRGAKLAHYRKLPSVKEVVLVEPNELRVEVFRRLETGQWLITDVTEGAAELESVGLSMPLDEVYAGVDRLPLDGADEDEPKTG